MVNIILPSRYKLNRREIKRATELIIQEYGFNETQVFNVVFVGKNKMRGLVHKYKKEDVALPVLSFSYKEEELIGEIFICYPQAVLLAAERERGVEQTIKNLIKHGIENIIK